MNHCAEFADLSDVDYLAALYRKTGQANIPFAGSLELTERCNLHCVHCYLGDQNELRHNRFRELNTGQWEGILDQVAEAGCLRLLITGGDPMLRKDFADIYRHAKELGLLVTLFTNGTLVTDAICNLFRELPPYKVEITLYGATAETYERVTGIPGSHARCWQGIGRLRALGVELGLKTVLLNQNKHEFQQLAEQAKTYGNQKFRFDVEIQAGFGRNLAPLVGRIDPADAVRLEFSDPAHAADWQEYYLRRQKQRPDPNDNRLYTCGAGISSFHINPYGGLQPCLTTRHISYDLGQGAFIEGWRSLQRKLANRKAPVGHACNSCENRMICNSCPASSMQETGAEEIPAPSQCQMTQLRVQSIQHLIRQAEAF
jgi:radical SAM protein with 4Fe4S-binding SPASM domain